MWLTPPRSPWEALDGFDPEVSTYVVDWLEHGRIPAVGAVARGVGRAGVKVVGGSSTVSFPQRGFTTRTDHG